MSYLIDGGAHLDVPASNIAIMAFQGLGDYVGGALFPDVPVEKQSNGYYVIDPADWLRIPETSRAPLTAAKLGEWKVSTDTYFAKNYSFGTMYALEALSNADAALRVRENGQRFVTETLLRARERRIALRVSSISNVGSGVALTGGNKFSDYVNSDPIAVVNTAQAFIANNTGMAANLMLVDKDTRKILRHHPGLRDYMKYTGQGPIPDAMLAELFDVDRIVVARGIYNSALEGATAVKANIWGNVMVLAHVNPAPIGLQTATFGLSMSWQPEGFPGAMAVERYTHHDKSMKAEVTEAQYFADEK